MKKADIIKAVDDRVATGQTQAQAIAHTASDLLALLNGSDEAPLFTWEMAHSFCAWAVKTGPR